MIEEVGVLDSKGVNFISFKKKSEYQVKAVIANYW